MSTRGPAKPINASSINVSCSWFDSCYHKHWGTKCWETNQPQMPQTCVYVLCVSTLSPVQLFVTPWTVAHQAPLSMGFSRQESWSGLPCSPPGDLPDPGIEPESLVSPALTGGFFTTEWKLCSQMDQKEPKRCAWPNCLTSLFMAPVSVITADGDYSHAIKRRFLLGRKVTTNLDNILKSRDITLTTKARLV